MADNYNVNKIKEQVEQAIIELVSEAKLEKDDIFVLGMSTSEVAGSRIGKDSKKDVGDVVVRAIKSILDPKGIHLAVQGCEHINRALVVEKSLAKERGFEMVNVKPALHAGGAGSMAAWDQADSPVEIEHIVADAGIDIGDTSIGMHVRHVQVPVRLQVKEIGQAHVTALRSRPKNIGGPRADYPEN